VALVSLKNATEQFMNISMTSRILVFFIGSLSSLIASAHGGGGGLSDDACRGITGSYSVHFTAYQPQYMAGTEYCWDVPRTGNTIVAFDLVQKELRTIPTEIRIVKDTPAVTPGSPAQTVALKETTTYPKGTVAVDTNFAESGRYVAVVTFNSTVPTIVKIPIRVEMKNKLGLIAVGGVGVALALAGTLWAVRRQRKSSAAVRI
jgi:hypothetical protein